MKIIHRFGSEAARTWSLNGQTMAGRQIPNGEENAPIHAIFHADTKQAQQIKGSRLIANPPAVKYRQKTIILLYG